MIMKNTECHVPRTNLFAWMIVALVLTAAAGTLQSAMERIVVAPDGKGFTTAQSRHRFVPWGMNYGNAGRLLEDFWDKEWPTLAGDFRELKELGANVGSSLFPMEWLLGLREGPRAKRCPGFGPSPVSRVSATHPNPAWHPKQPSLWPPAPPTPAPDPPASLTVVSP